MRLKLLSVLLVLLFWGTACNLDSSGPVDNVPDEIEDDELYRVVNVIDGDTIDVESNDGQTFRVRYVGVNTPERDETCYTDASAANRTLVEGKLVRLERDVSDTDRFDRLLRYVYVGDVFVNESLVTNGWAEVVSYPPDTLHFDRFRALEIQANASGLGCHSTGIFNDDSYSR